MPLLRVSSPPSSAGFVWGLIVRWSAHEVGFVAWGIGFLDGSAVVVGARGSRGVPYQAAAVVLALAGILIGKYLGFVWSLADALEGEGFLDAEVPIFSRATWGLFMQAPQRFRIPAVPRTPAEEPAAPQP